ncbi:mitochondrial 54S ribosomal protein mL54 [Kockiozyma suomiensis]|uniref:mitochondrial 54S ribosomal protein mL54 n=1 Tax=Kockiozyma suomiensis TaxID=1337062 RepID=UPI00334314DD
MISHSVVRSARLIRQFGFRRLFSSSCIQLFQEARAVTERGPSSVPEGARLAGCNVYKNKEDPTALADTEYPDWLWDILDPEAQQRKLDADPELKARREWRAKMRRKIKTDNFLKTMS